MCIRDSRKAALAGKYNYLNPKKSSTVPSEYIKQVLMRGTGFIGGKGRVCTVSYTHLCAKGFDHKGASEEIPWY